MHLLTDDPFACKVDWCLHQCRDARLSHGEWSSPNIFLNPNPGLIKSRSQTSLRRVMLLEILIAQCHSCMFSSAHSSHRRCNHSSSPGHRPEENDKEENETGATPQSFVSDEPLARWAEHDVEGTPPPRPSAGTGRMMDPSGRQGHQIFDRNRATT